MVARVKHRVARKSGKNGRAAATPRRGQSGSSRAASGRGFLVGGGDLAAGVGGHRPIDVQVNALGDKPDRAVGQAKVRAGAVVAAERVDVGPVARTVEPRLPGHEGVV